MDEQHNPLEIKRGRPRLIPEEKADAIIADYQSGKKLSKIETEYDVPRATIYWLLERRGIGSNRAKRNVRLQVDTVTAAHLYDLISEQEQLIAQLEQENQMLREKFDASNPDK